MFDLEQAIGEWRKEMLAAGIRAPVPLDELENHLREEIEEQIRSGVDLRKAFTQAVWQLGQAGQLKQEFRRTCRSNGNAKGWKGYIWMGGIGLAITILMNLLGRFGFHKSSSVLFSHAWWSDWLPNYIVWTSIIIAGVARGVVEWLGRRKKNAPLRHG